MEKLWAADSTTLRRIWGGVMGARFHALLHGDDLPAPVHPRRSIGHQHVLALEQRDMKIALHVVRRLLERAADRLRREKFYCTGLVTDIKFIGNMGYWSAHNNFNETRDTNKLSQILYAHWRDTPPLKPLRVGVTLTGLVQEKNHQMDLFDTPKNDALTNAVDQLNIKYGKGSVGFGLTMPSLQSMTSKIAFSRIPTMDEL